MNQLLETLLNNQDPAKVEGLSRFFKTGKGQYGEGDVFLGIKVPVTRSIVKDLWKDLSIEEIEECICSQYHEVRLAALLALVQKYKHSKKDKVLQKQYVDFYLAHTEHINNWDLVDLSCYEILGDWLKDKDRKILYDLAENGKTIWEKRIGIVSTMAFIRCGQSDDTFNIAEIIIRQKPLHDLLQKATGWLLRETGKNDMERLESWVTDRVRILPRTLLRYSIEKFPETKRQALLNA